MKLKTTLIATAVAALVVGTQAHGQLISRKDLSAGMALTMAQTALETCITNGYNVSVTVVGRNGEPLLQLRGDHTGPHTFENSLRKAYTARTFRGPSSNIETRLKSDPAFPLIHLANVIANRGGLPIMVGDDTIGGIGISGAPGGDKDEACAKAGIEKIAQWLN